jgi:hypothetical protein
VSMSISQILQDPTGSKKKSFLFGSIRFCTQGLRLPRQELYRLSQVPDPKS